MAVMPVERTETALLLPLSIPESVSFGASLHLNSNMFDNPNYELRGADGNKFRDHGRSRA